MKKFSFKILDVNPDDEYAAINPKDPTTFYLLANGYGYLGEVPLFNGGKQNLKVVSAGNVLTGPTQGVLYVMDGGTYNSEIKNGLFLFDGTNLVNYSDKILAAYLTGLMVTDMLAEEYAGDDTTIPTTKAIVDLINKKLTGSGILNVKFFRKVESHTITTEDLTNEAIDKPAGTAVGDVGLIFTADNDGDPGGEFYYFIGLKDYIKIYTTKNSNSIKMTISTSNEISADLSLKTGEASIIIDANGVSLKKSTVIDDDSPVADTLVTEAALVTYVHDQVLTAVNQAITDALSNVVTYEITSNEAP